MTLSEYTRECPAKWGDMAISENEAQQLIEHIEKTIRELADQAAMLGVIELMGQWKADVEAGRSVERKLSVRQSPGLDRLVEAPRSRSTTSGDFVGKEDYNNVEQLDMLVAALGLAYVAPPMMSKRLLDKVSELSEQKGQPEQSDLTIELRGVATSEESTPSLRISRASIGQSLKATLGLRNVLSEITREAELTQRRLAENEDGA